uniref:HpcH/HpaI aldolase/citrate lyase family protein n=1 Tax=Nocardia farcinica TaxID=37329 RepID=UPI0024540FA5
MTAPVALRQEVSLRKRLPLRHFRQLHGPDLRHLFHRQPEPFGDRADRELLAIALGATLYAPATRADLADTIRRRAERGVCSMVIDLEDAVADHEVETAKRRAVAARGPVAAAEVTPPQRLVRGGGAATNGGQVDKHGPRGAG